MKEHIWTTKDGKEILVKELEEGHLFNIYRWLHKKKQSACDLQDFAFSPFAPGEDTIAADDLDDALDESWDESMVINAWIGCIKEEIKRRGMDVPEVTEKRFWKDLTGRVKNIESGPNGMGTIMEIASKKDKLLL